MTTSPPPGAPPAAVRSHPCYGERAHARYARLHLAVAPRCNVTCAYCDRRVSDCLHTRRPGLAARLVRPAEVPDLIRAVLGAEPRLRVVGVAGPGEPLANPETFEALALARRAWAAGRGAAAPGPVLCVATNGLLLPEKVPLLLELGVTAVTVTVNAVSAAVGSRIYLEVRAGTGPAGAFGGEAGASLLIRRQLAGIRLAAAAGMVVKVNTVLIPGVNDRAADRAVGSGEAAEAGALTEVAAVARAAAAAGAYIHNIIPLIPLGALASRRPPTCDELRRARSEAGQFLTQFRLCRQCRADAVGVPGEEPDLAAVPARASLDRALAGEAHQSRDLEA